MLTLLPPLTELKRAARAAWPERRFERFRVHGEGWTNLVLEADDCIIFRFPRWREVAESLSFELRALDYLSRHLSTPIPRPVRVSVLSRPRGWPFVAYAKLPGRPLSEVGGLDSTGNRRLGELVEVLLSELASLPSRTLLRFGAKAGDRRAWMRKYLELQGRYRRVAEPHVPPRLRRALAGAFDRFYSALRESRYRVVATHQDLGRDHILWDRASNRPTGVIDWEDLRLGDPAFDLTGLAELGRQRLVALTRARKATEDATFDKRLGFYRRVVPLHGLLYAAETRNRPLLRECLTRLETNFGG